MPQVGNKKFPYTPAGQQQARQFAGSQGRPRPGQANTPGGWGQAAPSPGQANTPGRKPAYNPPGVAGGPVNRPGVGRSPAPGGGGVDPRLIQKIMQMLAAMQRTRM